MRTTATLQDQRDYYLDQLSQLMDIKVVQSDHNQIQVFTRAGTQLVGDRAASIIFDAKGSLSAASQWDVDPDQAIGRHAAARSGRRNSSRHDQLEA